MTTEQLTEIFTYHAPTPDQLPKYTELRAAGKFVATLINDLCPESREKSVAITLIQQAIQMANAAIAIHPVPPTV